MGADKGILRNLLGVLPITKQREDLGEDSPLVTEDQLIVRPEVAIAGALKGGLVGFGFHRLGVALGRVFPDNGADIRSDINCCLQSPTPLGTMFTSSKKKTPFRWVNCLNGQKGSADSLPARFPLPSANPALGISAAEAGLLLKPPRRHPSW